MFPAEADRLANPQTGVDKELEEEAPVVVRQSRKESTQLLPSKCLRPIVIDLDGRRRRNSDTANWV